MSQADIPELWAGVLAHEEAAALRRYQRPREVPPDLTRAALLVIDTVESFVGPDAPVLDAQSESRQACGSAAWRALPGIERLLTAFRARGAPIIYTVVAATQAAVGPATAGGAGPVGVLRGDVVVEPVAPAPGDVVIPKTKSSAFFGTPLVPALVRADVRTVVLTGGTTSGCVLASAVDAASNGFEVVVAGDACFDRVESLASAALVTMDAKWARVWSTEGVLARLDAGGPPGS